MIEGRSMGVLRPPLSPMYSALVDREGEGCRSTPLSAIILNFVEMKYNLKEDTSERCYGEDDLCSMLN